MAKNKEKEIKAVEPTQEGSVEVGVEEVAEVEAKREKIQAAVVIGIDPEGKLVIQDGLMVFGEEQVESPMTDELYVQIIRNISKDIEKAELVSAVKAEMAKAFGGDK